jgi:hypothetical protein
LGCNFFKYAAFETDNNNTLRFEQRLKGADERIYLLYDDNETHAINYGGVTSDEFTPVSGPKAAT